MMARTGDNPRCPPRSWPHRRALGRRRAPAALRDRVPRVARSPSGREVRLIEGETYLSDIGAIVVGSDGEKRLGLGECLPRSRSRGDNTRDMAIAQRLKWYLDHRGAIGCVLYRRLGDLSLPLPRGRVGGLSRQTCSARASRRFTLSCTSRVSGGRPGSSNARCVGSSRRTPQAIAFQMLTRENAPTDWHFCRDVSAVSGAEASA